MCDLERKAAVPNKSCRACSEEKPYRDFASIKSEKCKQCAEKKAIAPMKCKRCGHTKPELVFATERTNARPSTTAKFARVSNSVPWVAAKPGAIQMLSVWQQSRKSSCAASAGGSVAAPITSHP